MTISSAINEIVMLTHTQQHAYICCATSLTAGRSCWVTMATKKHMHTILKCLWVSKWLFFATWSRMRLNAATKNYGDFKVIKIIRFTWTLTLFPRPDTHASKHPKDALSPAARHDHRRTLNFSLRNTTAIVLKQAAPDNTWLISITVCYEGKT